MAWTVLGRTIRKIGVIGSGQIGPDIALHFSKVMEAHQVPVIVVDVAPDALEKGQQKTAKKLEKGVESGAFEAGQAKRILENLRFTTDYAQLEGASLVVEAATENLDIKRKIFSTLEGIVGADCILTSNSSHLEPERVFEQVANPGRCLVTHYFFPAERNPALEVVPGAHTQDDVTRFMLRFYERVGKVPVKVGSRYGFAVDPIFEGLFLAALLLVDEGVGTAEEVDQVAKDALGQGIGPFTAMNLAGGNPLTAAGMPQYHDRVHKWFHCPDSLTRAVAAKTVWPTAPRGQKLEVGAQKARVIRENMLGAYIGLATEVLNSGIIRPADLEIAVELALVMKSPLALINEVGVKEALRLVEAYHAKYPAFPVPAFLEKQAATGKPFEIPHVIREDEGPIAVLTLRRPRVLNALSGEVFHQLGQHLDAIRANDDVLGVVLTGFGSKAFAAGADITELAALRSGDEAARVALRDQGVVNKLESLGKPVVCALNGLALGGGSEVAQACTTRIATKGLPVCFGQPEVNLGIIPGCGGTQRLPRIIGAEAAWKVLRSGRPVNGADSVQMGFLHEEVEGELHERAVQLARDIALGHVTVKTLDPAPMTLPAKLPDVNIGHLSTQVDEFVQRAFREGLTRPLAEGLKVEAKLFGEVFETEDSRIGLGNFVKNGPRAKAAFQHTTPKIQEA